MNNLGNVVFSELLILPLVYHSLKPEQTRAKQQYHNDYDDETYQIVYIIWSVCTVYYIRIIILKAMFIRFILNLNFRQSKE